MVGTSRRGRPVGEDAATPLRVAPTSAWLGVCLCACLVVLSACGPATARPPTPDVDRGAQARVVGPAQTPPGAATRRLLAAVNEARAVPRACGAERLPAAPPLGWDGALAQAAEGHARAMATLGFVDHVSPTGSTVGDRIRASGYEARAWGETIAAGYVDPDETVRGFLDSPSHCAILMGDAFEALGAALVEDDASVYGSYWTLVFAAPR